MGLRESWLDVAGKSPDGKKYYVKGHPPVVGKSISGWSGDEVEMSRSAFSQANRRQITRRERIGPPIKLQIVRQDASFVWFDGTVPGVNGRFETDPKTNKPVTKIPRSALRSITGGR